jgi:hypothetical protein
MRDVKIQEITEFEPAEAEITEQLASMHCEQRFDHLQLDYYPLSHEKIDSIAIIDRQILVLDRDQNLPAHRQTVFF